MKSNLSYSLETHNLAQIQHFFCPMRPWNLTDDLENNRVPLLTIWMTTTYSCCFCQDAQRKKTQRSQFAILTIDGKQVAQCNSCLKTQSIKAMRMKEHVKNALKHRRMRWATWLLNFKLWTTINWMYGLMIFIYCTAGQPPRHLI